MEKVKELFLKLGYTEEDYAEIVASYPLSKSKPETLITHVEENYQFFISVGYSREEVIKMTKGSPSMYSVSIENLKQKIEDMENLGYSREEVIKMTKGLPTIYSVSIENLKQKIEDMENLGYSREEVIKMTKGLPSIYSVSIENLKQKIEDMENLGYSRAEVIKMTKGLPSIYGLSIENMRQKIEFYDSIGLHSLAILAPKCLMQSTKLSYARYMFFKEKSVSIDETNYAKLFASQKKFERQYGIPKEELLARYPYVQSKEPGNKIIGIENEQDLDKKSEEGNVSKNTKEELIEEIITKQEKIAAQNKEIDELRNRRTLDEQV